jgi:hypothetical protein
LPRKPLKSNGKSAPNKEEGIIKKALYSESVSQAFSSTNGCGQIPMNGSETEFDLHSLIGEITQPMPGPPKRNALQFRIQNPQDVRAVAVRKPRSPQFTRAEYDAAMKEEDNG